MQYQFYSIYIVNGISCKQRDLLIKYDIFQSLFGEGMSEDAVKAHGGAQQLTMEKWVAINKTKEIMKNCPRDFE